MNTEQVRNKLAELAGWSQDPKGFWMCGGKMIWDHPVPNTLEEASKIPAGFDFEICSLGNKNFWATGWPLGKRSTDAWMEVGKTELEARFKLRLALEEQVRSTQS